jgi:hypothetical protein
MRFGWCHLCCDLCLFRTSHRLLRQFRSLSSLPRDDLTTLEIDSSCHNPNSTTVVESLCLGKVRLLAFPSLDVVQSSCTIPSDVDFWTDPCYGQIKRLSVQVCSSLSVTANDAQVECSEVDSIDSVVIVPVGVTSEVCFRCALFNSSLKVTLPFYGITNPVVTESGVTIWSNGQYVPGVAGLLLARSP